MGLTVLGPDVNESQYTFSVNKNGEIRFGLGAILGLGSAPVDAIVSERIDNIKKINEKKIVNKARKYLKNYSLKDTVDLILETEKVNKRKIYNLCLKIKNEESF